MEVHRVKIQIHNKCQWNNVQSVWRAGFASERLENIQALKSGTSGFHFQLCYLLWDTGKVT